MSINQKRLKTEIQRRLSVNYGWPQDTSTHAAVTAVDVLLDLYGGEKHYVGKRQIDKELIRRQFEQGVPIPRLAREHCRTARCIRQIVYGN